MKYLSRRAVFLLVVLSISGIVLVYPPMRLASLLWPENPLPAWVAVILLGTPITLRVLHEQMHHAWSRLVSSWVMTWLGACFVLLCLLLPAEVLLLTGLVHAHPVGASVAATAVAIVFYSVYNAHRIHIHEVPLRGPSNLTGTTLVQISDVHIGSRQPGFLKPIVHKVNQLKPDYVLITGDLIDMQGIDQDSLAPLAELQAPTLFCIGNHERYVDLEDICQRLTNLDIEVLRNQAVRKDDLLFIGIDDAENKTQVSKHIKDISPVRDTYNILLYHRPDDAEAAAAWGVDLMVTGHTHRGQIFPFNFLVKKVFPKLYRGYQIENMLLYVSPGTGTWGPVMRLGSKCEITLFRL